jgi:hypothetical protein
MKNKSLIETMKPYQEALNNARVNFEVLTRQKMEEIEYDKLTGNQRKELQTSDLRKAINSSFRATDKDESAYHIFGGKGLHDAYNKAMKNELLKWQNNSK